MLTKTIRAAWIVASGAACHTFERSALYCFVAPATGIALSRAGAVTLIAHTITGFTDLSSCVFKVLGRTGIKCTAAIRLDVVVSSAARAVVSGVTA